LLVNDSVNTIPRELTRATIGRLLLGNSAIKTPRQQYRLCFPWGYKSTEDATEFRTVVESDESSFGTPAYQDMSLELN
jgi:hypothetical protein